MCPRHVARDTRMPHSMQRQLKLEPWVQAIAHTHAVSLATLACLVELHTSTHTHAQLRKGRIEEQVREGI